jgi:hypothetical protein
MRISSAWPPRFSAPHHAGKILKRSQQERAKAPLGLVDGSQCPAFDQMLEKTLHQVLGVFRAVPAMAGEGV